MGLVTDVNGTKIIRRYNPFLLICCIFSICLVATLVVACFLPCLTLNYVEAGVTHKVDVNAWTFLQALFNRINTNAHTELGDSFLTFLRDQRGTTLNQIQMFLINGAGGRMEQIFILTMAGLILLSALIGAVLVIFATIGIMFGRLHSPKVLKGFSGAFFGLFTTLTIVFSVFAWLYGDIIKAIVSNTANEVTAGSLDKIYMIFIFDGVIFILMILIAAIYRGFLKGRVFVNKVKVNQ